MNRKLYVRSARRIVDEHGRTVFGPGAEVNPKHPLVEAQLSKCHWDDPAKHTPPKGAKPRDPSQGAGPAPYDRMDPLYEGPDKPQEPAPERPATPVSPPADAGI